MIQIEKRGCCKHFHKQRDSPYYLLIDSNFLETVIQSIGKFPIENCRVKTENNNFSQKQTVNARRTIPLAKKFQAQEQMISPSVGS